MERLLSILHDINSEIDYTSQEHLVDEGIFASFDILQCSMACEDEFGVEIPAEAITAANFQSAGAIWSMVSALIEEQR